MKTIEVKEGKVTLRIPDPQEYTIEGKFDPAWSPVFYNQRMKINRDISVGIARILSPRVVIDAFSASGVRGIRYAVEAGAKHVIFNDIDREAVKLAEENARMNSVPSFEVYNMDANALLDSKRALLIDIDPFGSPASFIQSSMRSVVRHGVVGLTATDLSPLEGSSPLSCRRKYYTMNTRKLSFSKEVGIRILIGKAARDAAVEEKGIFPLISFYYGHFFRTFIRVEEGARKADSSLDKLGFVAECTRCGYHKFSTDQCELRKCEHCGNEMVIAGPLWLGDLYEEDIVQKLDVEDSAQKLLSKIRGEIGAPAFYYSLDKLSSKLKLGAVPSTKDVVECTSGYFTHFDPKGVKTRATFEEVLSCVKRLVK